MRTIWFACALALAAVFAGQPAAASSEKLVISAWGGSWKEMVAKSAAARFTAETGIEVEIVSGGTIDRLNKAKLAKGDPESDLTLTTSHVGWLYQNDGLFETLDFSRIPNAKNIFPEAKISPGHVGLWSYVYTIGYNPDLVPDDVKFESWADLWNPKLKGMIALPDFDPSHIIVAAAVLSGGDASNWEVGKERLLALKPNIKAFYTNDASSQQMMASGESPVQVLLSGNAFHQMDQGVSIKLVIPKEGAIVGIDAIGIMKGTKHLDWAYQFINAAFHPESQAIVTGLKKLGPMNPATKIDPATAALPGVFTTAQQWSDDALIIDHKLRAEKLGEWKQWFAENMIGQ